MPEELRSNACTASTNLSVASWQPSGTNLDTLKAAWQSASARNSLRALQTFEGSDVIYHIHSPDSPTLLLFHGCVHRAEHFFPPSSGCPKCVGLPEDLAITRAAAAAGYNVVAFTSLDRKSGCWSRPDRQAVLASHKALAEQEKLLAAAPLYGLGASSGGAFLLRLANYLPFQAIVPMIANRTKPRPGSEQPPTLAPYPPTLFVHMTRDTTMTVRIAADVKVRVCARWRRIGARACPFCPLSVLLRACAPLMSPEASCDGICLWESAPTQSQPGCVPACAAATRKPGDCWQHADSECARVTTKQTLQDVRDTCAAVYSVSALVFQMGRALRDEPEVRALPVQDMLASGGYAAAVGVEPLPIGPKFFADRITDMSGADSDHLQKVRSGCAPADVHVMNLTNDQLPRCQCLPAPRTHPCSTAMRS